MNIQYNGSHWAGEKPDTLDVLLRALAEETLNPLFEEYGNFVFRENDGMIQCWGNFLTVSHVFCIDGTEEEMAPLIGAIRFNQSTHQYLAAKANLIRSRTKEKRP
jgi:hypothetical protein